MSDARLPGHDSCQAASLFSPYIHTALLDESNSTIGESALQFESKSLKERNAIQNILQKTADESL